MSTQPRSGSTCITVCKRSPVAARFHLMHPSNPLSSHITLKFSRCHTSCYCASRCRAIRSRVPLKATPRYSATTRFNLPIFKPFTYYLSLFTFFSSRCRAIPSRVPYKASLAISRSHRTNPSNPLSSHLAPKFFKPQRGVINSTGQSPVYKPPHLPKPQRGEINHIHFHNPPILSKRFYRTYQTNLLLVHLPIIFKPPSYHASTTWPSCCDYSRSAFR